MNTELNINTLAEDYIAVWNEPDEAQRKARIRRLWAKNGKHFTPSMAVHGYEELDARVTTAYQKWVQQAGYRFHHCGEVQDHHLGVYFQWEMRDANGKTVSVGFDFLQLDEAGAIISDHQFLGKNPA
ncbi:MAG: hypothetical protein HYR68_01020 [Burkholderiales bacterium]|nr:hypothetical protein [Burkholderiales bacterium]MBI3730176.1 hypothetical protein [Burkholderiales bacterium]